MALKSVDDVEGNAFDDELSATEIAYLAKNFRNFLRNNNRRVRGKNNAEPRNFRRNEPTKVNNNEKPKEKVGQTSNNSMGQQCFGCEGYGHVKSEYPTFLRSKGKVIAVTLSDDEVSDNESGSDKDEKVSNMAMLILQEAYNKLCKVVAKDAMNVDLGLQKIASLELDKKNLLLKLLDANELLDKVKTENMLLLDKVKNFELELSVVREQTNRSVSSKLEHMLSIQKSPLDKIGLGFEDSISMPKNHSINFVSSSKPPMSEIVKSAEVTLLRKIRVDFKESKPKTPNPSKDKLHDRLAWVCHFCGKFGHIRPNCFKLQVAKRANKPKVPTP